MQPYFKQTVAFVRIYFLFFGFTPIFMRPPILAVLFLRKAFWTPTINTLFVFHAPFSTHLFSTRCHYTIQILIIISKSMHTVEFMGYLAQDNFQPGRAVEQCYILSGIPQWSQTNGRICEQHTSEDDVVWIDSQI
jgi:hypothetical protein